jgi:hypothetical protein
MAERGLQLDPHLAIIIVVLQDTVQALKQVTKLFNAWNKDWNTNENSIKLIVDPIELLPVML